MVSVKFAPASPPTGSINERALPPQQLEKGINGFKLPSSANFLGVNGLKSNER